MFDNLTKAERHWQRRNLFRNRRRRGRWLAGLATATVVVALIVWQQEALAWLADVVG